MTSVPDVGSLSAEQKDDLLQSFLRVMSGAAPSMTSRPSGTAASSAAISCNAAATANPGDTAALANPSLLANLGATIGNTPTTSVAPTFSAPTTNPAPIPSSALTPTPSGSQSEHGSGQPSAGWRTSTRPFAGTNANVTGTSTSAFAAAASRFSNLAKPTTRGRPPKDAVSVKIKRNTINLIPVAAWNLSMSSKGKPGDFDNFLDDQHCQIKAAGIKKNFTAAEVMSFIITTFAQKGWDMKEKGFQYARTVGNQDQLKPAAFNPAEVDGAKLEEEYRSERCFIVVDNDDWPTAFQAYFQAADLPPVNEQKRDTLAECLWCLLVLPKSIVDDHTLLCPRFLKGFDTVPRKLGGQGTPCGGTPLDYDHAFFKKDLAGLHLPHLHDDSLCEDHKRNPQKIPEWKDPAAFCLCRGLGHSEEWIECSSQENCVVRWFHYGCMEDAAGGELPAEGWTCFLCMAIRRHIKAGKRRRHN